MDWYCVTYRTGHCKLFNYPSSFLPQAPEAASKLMGLEADPELEKVCLCHGWKPLSINKMHVYLWLDWVIYLQTWYGECSSSLKSY